MVSHPLSYFHCIVSCPQWYAVPWSSCGCTASGLLGPLGLASTILHVCIMQFFLLVQASRESRHLGEWYLYLLFSSIIGILWFTFLNGGSCSGTPFMMSSLDFIHSSHNHGMSSLVNNPFWFVLFMVSLIAATRTSLVLLLVFTSLG
jgi:hypothetical protein